MFPGTVDLARMLELTVATVQPVHDPPEGNDDS